MVVKTQSVQGIQVSIIYKASVGEMEIYCNVTSVYCLFTCIYMYMCIIYICVCIHKHVHIYTYIVKVKKF